MFYKSVFIHKNRIFPYFQNKVKNVNNVIIIIIIIIIIIMMMIINIRKLIIQKKIKRKDTAVLFRINLA